MQSLKEIKKRIKATKNIEQITKAMEVVSMTKMRKSQAFALSARPYAVASLQILKNLLNMSPIRPDFLKQREINNSLLIVVTADKGLVGAFNENVLKKAENWINKKKIEGKKFSIITVGKKAKEYFERRKISAEKSFLNFGDFSELEETLPVANLILNGWKDAKWDEAEAVYTNFISTLKQEMAMKKILPVTEQGIEEVVRDILPRYGRGAEVQEKIENFAHDYNYEYKIEPSPAEVLETLIPDLIRIHVHHIILESNASEHSARMVTMKNASDNARELKGELNLVYNKARQSGITSELSEIISGQESLSK